MEQLFIEVLSRSFRPAASPAETTHWFSTAEIISAVKNINPSFNIEPESVHDAMISAGYSYGVRPGSQALILYWMLVAL